MQDGKGGYGTGFKSKILQIFCHLSEQDIDFYVTKLNKTGYRGARNLNIFIFCRQRKFSTHYNQSHISEFGKC